MGETVRKAGVRAVKQEACTTMKQLRAFCATLSQQPFKCVVKPGMSAGTDDVFLCSSLDDAEVAFERILGKRNGVGLINESVLAQEFLVGKEYVIDKVTTRLECEWYVTYSTNYPRIVGISPLHVGISGWRTQVSVHLGV